MSRKAKAVGNTSREKKHLFIEANAAWDNGDLQEAFTLFTQSAELGDRGSQVDLGYFFDQGLFVKKNKKKAMEWYRRAHLQGDAGAANNIATLYRSWGHTKKMLWWFRRAAAMGDLDVVLELGRRYEKGLAVPRNLTKAKVLYRRVLASKHATEEDKAVARDRLIALGDQRALKP